jgi:CRISPR/Cas system-associated exonuclease Cas4 (RecB family)
MTDFTWSYSSLKEYENCPRKYHQMRVLQNYKIEPTPQMIYGTEVHKALEDYVREGKELAKNYQRFKKVVDTLINIPGTKYPEYQMALNKKFQPCDFDDEKRWVRGIVDLLIVNGNEAFIVDYKTGSNKYPDPKQLRLMALMTFAHFPEITIIRAGLLFILKNSFVQETYTRETIHQSWKKFEQSLDRLTLSYRDDMWTPNPYTTLWMVSG